MFRHIYQELIDENPLAVRAVLKILHLEFTPDVPTLAVTCEQRPTLRVNLAFVREHCRTEHEVRAVLIHEFLHVLLRHTERFTPVTWAEHLAFDAVINAIIHRTMGVAASAMMSRYYAQVTGPYVWLRPPTVEEHRDCWAACSGGGGVRGRRRRQFAQAWLGLYDGRLVADDIRDLAETLCSRAPTAPGWLGNHAPPEGARTRSDADGASTSAPDVDSPSDAERQLAEALNTALQSMNGHGVFRSPLGRGVGAAAYQATLGGAHTGVERWRRETYAVLRRYLLPDPRAAREATAADALVPVLTPGDRRATLRAMWSAFLPDARWTVNRPQPVGSAQVYLDASGSMNAELPLLVTLLARLSGYIRRPFWAFSTEVMPARIEQGRLVTGTTGGTSMRCVLAHIARTRPRAAVVVTDGYIEALAATDVAAVRATRLHILVTRDGTTAPFDRVGLPYTQLGKVPQ